MKRHVHRSPRVGGEVGPSEHKVTPPFPSQQFPKIPRYLRFLFRVSLCIKVLIKMQPEPEKRGTSTRTREEHRATPHPPRGRTTLAFTARPGRACRPPSLRSHSGVCRALCATPGQLTRKNTRDNTDVPVSLRSAKYK